MYPNQIIERAKKIKCLICDVDGVLTDGKIYMGNDGELMRSFHTQDGLGMKLLLQSGIEIAIITGLSSRIVPNRMESLGVKLIYQGNPNKRKAYSDLKQKLNLDDEQMAHIGDDLTDLPLLKQVGFAVTVADAVEGIAEHCHWQTKRNGGCGAVRELCHLLLAAQGKLELIESQYE